MERTASFGYWVRRRRKALDLTQEELARQVGCVEVTIKKIEADERRPSRQLAERLAESLQLAPAERAAFVQAARGELATDRLDVPPPPASAARLPGGTLTFLFTDIEGSTRLWERHKEAMPSALARHNAILRQATQAHGGAVFRTVGDAFYTAFASAPAALRTALAAQRALQIEPWGETGPIRVRMALHSGTVELRDGEYQGQPLNRIARLLAAGHGGQVLLSRATGELLYDQLPPEVQLRDLGTHGLKGLSRPEPIYQLVAEDLPSIFPPLTSLDRPATNLPAQATTFIGREQQEQALHSLLHRPDVRLITLSGPGGTGKTRLAIEAAAALALTPDPSPAPAAHGHVDASAAREKGATTLLPPSQRETSEAQRAGWLGGEGLFPDGLWFVDLTPISDPGLVASTIAQAFGLREFGGQPIQDMLKQYLRAKRMLLLLDNFEQVIAVAPLIAELLAAAPQLKILVTSRVVLRISGEREFAVPPLALPSEEPRRQNQEPAPACRDTVLDSGFSVLSSAEALTQYEAVRLFVERAQAVRADFAVTRENAQAIVEICRRLDGLPLAIELAAVRVKLLAPQALLARLNDRFALLTGGARDLPPRQQTLRTTLDWSYNLLTPAEQRLFRRLAVFVGGWTLESAEAVCDIEGDLGLSVLDGMQVLMDSSLVRQEEGLDGAPRFRRLETIRAYAIERLEESGEAAALRRRHAEHFLALAELADAQLQRAGQSAWLGRLEAEHDNLRAALAWAFDGGDVELGGRIALALTGRAKEHGFWTSRGYWSEQRHWMKTALGKRSGVAPALHAMLLIRIAHLASIGGYGIERQDAMHEEALALFRAAGDTPGIALALLYRGYSLWNSEQPDLARAMRVLEEALVLYQELGDRHGSAVVLHQLGDVVRDRGDLERAEALLEESIAIMRELGVNEVELALVLNGMGDVACRQGDYARATALYWEAVLLLRKIGDRWSVLWPLRNLAWLTLVQGDDGRVLALLEEHVEWFRDKQEMIGLMFLTHLLGLLVNAQGDAKRAMALLREAVALHLRYMPRIPESLDGFAWMAAGQGQPARAARLLGATEALSKGLAHDSCRSAHEQIVVAVRAQLDEAAFAAAWAAGQAMSLEQAIAYALDESK